MGSLFAAVWGLASTATPVWDPPIWSTLPTTINFSCQPSSVRGPGDARRASVNFRKDSAAHLWGCKPQSSDWHRNCDGPDYPQPYIEQFNLTLQKQIGQNVFTATYVGELGRREGISVNRDRPLPKPGPVQPFVYATQLPMVSTITNQISDGASSYNAVMLIFERRYAHGLILNANYTWARGLNDLGR